MDASYWFCVLLIGIYLFILLRRHIFVFFTRIYPFVSHLLACLLLSHCAYRGPSMHPSGDLSSRLLVREASHEDKRSTSDVGSFWSMAGTYSLGELRP